MIDGIRFPSKLEGRRYCELKLMLHQGLISDLELQPAFVLVVNGVKIGVYRGDFRYKDVATGKSVTEDTKGMLTSVYKLKKKLVHALYGVDIVEVS